MSIYNQNARSVGGITVGRSWLRNNPNLDYPEGHESMTDDELELALRSDIMKPDSYHLHDAIMLDPKSTVTRT